MEMMKMVERENRLVVGKFSYKLLNGDIAFPKSEVNFGKQILASHYGLPL
jgi:hypothetical protein